jgi:hypothetical protein
MTALCYFNAFASLAERAALSRIAARYGTEPFADRQIKQSLEITSGAY